MKFLLVYVDAYDRSERMRMFASRSQMDTFILREEVRSVVSIYWEEALDTVGVDNWEGYNDAISLYQEWKND